MWRKAGKRNKQYLEMVWGGREKRNLMEDLQNI